MSTEAAKSNAANHDEEDISVQVFRATDDSNNAKKEVPDTPLMDENKRPPPGSTNSINSKALGAELGNPTGGDVVLVPVNPRLSAPSIAAPGSLTQSHIDRRKRLFSAKRSFEFDSNVPMRKKRVAKKSSTRSKGAMRRLSDQVWDDYFHHDDSQKTPPPTAQAATSQRTTKTAAAAATTKSDNPKSNTTSEGPAAKAKPKAKPAAANRPVEIYRGPPDEDVSDLGGWPPGWIKILVQRKGGSTKGTKDRYWFSPEGRRFRSMKEVQKFLKALTACNGVEDEAKKIYQSMAL